jgi:hypothetical protein
VFCFSVGDILVVAPNEYLASVNDVVEESTCFVCCEEFLLSDGVLQLCVIEFSRKGTDDLFCAVVFLRQHCTHGVLLGGVWVDDESFVGVWVGTQNGVSYLCFYLVESLGFFLSPDKWYVLFGEMRYGA